MTALSRHAVRPGSGKENTGVGEIPSQQLPSCGFLELQATLPTFPLGARVRAAPTTVPVPKMSAL